jgi:hypothetical protein
MAIFNSYVSLPEGNTIYNHQPTRVSHRSDALCSKKHVFQKVRSNHGNTPSQLQNQYQNPTGARKALNHIFPFWKKPLNWTYSSWYIYIHIYIYILMGLSNHGSQKLIQLQHWTYYNHNLSVTHIQKRFKLRSLKKSIVATFPFCCCTPLSDKTTHPF